MDTNKKCCLSDNITNNRVMILLLGVCPILGASNDLKSALTMSLAFSLLLVLVVLTVKVFKNYLSSSFEIGLVTIGYASIIEMLVHAYIPSGYNGIATFSMLLSLSFLVIKTAKEVANTNNVPSIFKVISTFVIAILTIAIVREVLGNATFMGNEITFLTKFEIPLLNSNVGAFMLLGFVMALFNLKEVK